MSTYMNQKQSKIAMELPDIYFDKNEYVETASGNKVCRQTVLCGSQNIVLNGKVIVHTDAIIRGDLTNVRTGRYCVIGRNSVLRPPYKKFSKGLAFFPLQIGDHVYIGENAVVNAAFVGSYVYIGNNVVIGRRCVLKDCCVIADNAVLAPETTVPSYMRFEGSPAKCTGDLPECTQDSMVEFTKSYYEHFTAARTVTQVKYSLMYRMVQNNWPCRVESASKETGNCFEHLVYGFD